MKVEINGDEKEIDADIIKLSRTLWNKEGDKYTLEEMQEFGFELEGTQSKQKTNLTK